jgi:nicotinamidase-related amidase
VKNETKGQPMSKNQNAVSLLVIDVQNGLFHKSTPIYKAEELLSNIDELTERAHRVGARIEIVQFHQQLIPAMA